MVVLAPTHSTALVRDSRRLIRAGELFGPEGEVRVLGVGELLPLAGARRGAMPAPPVDISRTIEEALSTAPPDFVHVHEPFAPSAASVALRHSRSLNVGSFHAPAERVLSTQVARRFVELFFGRLDARTASFGATRDLMQRIFPADYRVLRPGARAARARRARRPAATSPSATRRSAARCGCSCARCAGCRPSSSGRRRCSCPPGRRRRSARA